MHFVSASPHPCCRTVLIELCRDTVAGSQMHAYSGLHPHVFDESRISQQCLSQICLSKILASLRMLCCGGLVTLLPPCPLLEQLISSVGQQPELAVFDTREPVAKAATDSSVDGVHPKRLLVEERAHLNAELP
jgi:hypothetical protein